MKCPYCHHPAVEITCMDEVVKRFLCTGPRCHEFTNEFVAKDGEAESLIVL